MASPSPTRDGRKLYLIESYRNSDTMHHMYQGMSRLAPSEPLFLDLPAEPNYTSRQTAISGRYHHQRYATASSRRTKSSGANHPPKPARNPSPILFGDADTASDMTGQSQQELLRKKARADKSKKKKVISNMPFSHQTPWKTLHDDISTAESTYTGSHEFGTPYSTLPRQKPVIHEAADRGDRLQVMTWMKDDETFPILSRNAAEWLDPKVRFPENPAAVHVFDFRSSAEAIPWDEQADGTVEVAIDRLPFKKPVVTPTTHPKPILRPSRFSSPQGGAQRMHRRTGWQDDDAALLQVNTSVSKSPPRNSFVENGMEMSPILSPEVYGTAKMVRQSAYVSPDEESHYSDPPLELNLEDESTVVSTVGFIQVVAAIVIQTTFRRYRAMCLFGKQMHLHPKTMLLPNEDEFAQVALQMYILAAIRIQSVFRGFWVRDNLSVDHYCAKVIQKAYRGFVCRHEYLFDVYRIILVQVEWRRQLAKRKVAKLKATKALKRSTRGASRSHANGYDQRMTSRSTAPMVVPRHPRQFTYMERRTNTAATVIQARWRGYIGELHFIRTLVDVLIVQTIVRRWIANRRVQSIRENGTAQWRVRSNDSRSGKDLVSVNRNVYSKSISSESFGGSARDVNLKPTLVVDKLSYRGFGPSEDEKKETCYSQDSVSTTEMPSFLNVPDKEDNPGSTRNLLALWKERDKKNTLVLDKK